MYLYLSIWNVILLKSVKIKTHATDLPFKIGSALKVESLFQVDYVFVCIFSFLDHGKFPKRNTRADLKSKLACETER